MGVKTKLTLIELNNLFPLYNFISIVPTTSGIIDTTYIISTQYKSYILKKYERDISIKVKKDISLLRLLKSYGFNVSTCIDKKDEWFIYEKLIGSEPVNIQTYHIQSLARFLAKLHKSTVKIPCITNKKVENDVIKALKYTKYNFFRYYKILESLKYFSNNNNHFIHGDIFKDNTIFNGSKIGVIDFIDSSCGSFSFDIAVALIGFDIKKKNTYYINLFIKTYNQRALKKLNKQDIIKKMTIASKFYALKRIYKYKNTLKAKELL